MDQLSFSDAEHNSKRKQTKRERFLLEMDKVIPWKRLEELISPHYPKWEGKGRKPYEFGTMLRIYCLQQWYNLRDPGMEKSFYEIHSMRQFAKLSLSRGSIPDETTILHFRHLLEKHQLTQAILSDVVEYLNERGLMLRTGTIMDATIITAPPSTKNKKKARDPEMHQTKKDNQWYFGMKARIGVDARNGLVHSVHTTAANVHDIVAAEHLLHGEEAFAIGGSGYQGIQKRDEFKYSETQWQTVPRPSRYQSDKLSDKEKEVGQKNAKFLSSIRAKVEQPFRIIKRQFGYTKTRYKGLYKNSVQINMLFALANLYRARRVL
jgi:IS5 family transposase